MTAIFKHLFIDSSSGFETRSVLYENQSVLISTPEHWNVEGYEHLRTREQYQVEGYFLDTERFPTYEEQSVIINNQSHPLSEFILENRLRQCIIHNDPEFQNWTFGIYQGDSLRGAVLNHLDLMDNGETLSIFMVASMREYSNGVISDRWAKFLVGVFEVNQVKYENIDSMGDVSNYHCISEIDYQNPLNEERIHNNFHYKARLSEEYEADSMFILLGDQNRSLLSPTPIRLSPWSNDRDDLGEIFPELGNFRSFRGFRYIEFEEILRGIISHHDYHNHPDF